MNLDLQPSDLGKTRRTRSPSRGKSDEHPCERRPRGRQGSDPLPCCGCGARYARAREHERDLGDGGYHVGGRRAQNPGVHPGIPGARAAARDPRSRLRRHTEPALPLSRPSRATSTGQPLVVPARDPPATKADRPTDRHCVPPSRAPATRRRTSRTSSERSRQCWNRTPRTRPPWTPGSCQCRTRTHRGSQHPRKTDQTTGVRSRGLPPPTPPHPPELHNPRSDHRRRGRAITRTDPVRT